MHGVISTVSMNKLMMMREMTQTFMNVFYLLFRSHRSMWCFCFFFKFKWVFSLYRISHSKAHTWQMTHTESTKRTKWTKTHSLLMGKCDAIVLCVCVCGIETKSDGWILSLFPSLVGLCRKLQFNNEKNNHSQAQKRFVFIHCYLSRLFLFAETRWTLHFFSSTNENSHFSSFYV